MISLHISNVVLVDYVVMSSDDDENVMLESLAGGAVFFIVKPVDPDGLKNVWQYAVAARKGKSLLIEDMDRESSSSSPADGKLSLGGNTKSSSSENNEKKDPKKGSKRKGAPSKGKDKDKDDKDDESKSPPPKKAKKPKIVWTNTLHNQFLEALRQIGLESVYIYWSYFMLSCSILLINYDFLIHV